MVRSRSWSACTEITTLGRSCCYRRRISKQRAQTWSSFWTRFVWTAVGATKQSKYVSTTWTHYLKWTKSLSSETPPLTTSIRPNREKGPRKSTGKKKDIPRPILRLKPQSWSEGKPKCIRITWRQKSTSRSSVKIPEAYRSSSRSGTQRQWRTLPIS